MNLKKCATLLSFASLALFACAGVVQAKTALSIATGGVAGAYFPIGGAIAQAASKGGDLQATAETGNASVANLNLLGKGEIEIAFAQNDTAFWAYNGQHMFKTPLKNLRAIAVLFPEHIQVVASKDAKITDVASMKGKRVGVGAPGSGTEADARAMIESGNLTYQDMKVDYLDFAATASRFKDNQIDVGFIVAGYPTAAIMDLATSRDITLVSFSDAYLADLAKKYPYFVPNTIPANTYRGIDKDTKTPAVMAMLLTHDKMKDEVIYSFLKNMFGNIDAVHASHNAAKQITLQNALKGVTAPLHPGAIKFYKEKGLTVPDIK